MNDKILASWGSESYPICLRLTEFKGSRFVDLRKYYGEHATKKGIMLRAAQLQALIDALGAHRESVEEWFEGESTTVAHSVSELQKQLELARRENAQKLHVASVTDDAAGGKGHLFELAFAGGAATVALNPRHRLVKALDRAVAGGDEEGARTLIARVLQATFHAAALGGKNDGLDPDAAENFAHLLGILLSQVDVEAERVGAS